MHYGVVQGAEDGGHTHFSCRVFVSPDGVTSKTHFYAYLIIVSIEFYLGNLIRVNLALSDYEICGKTRFRRDAVWSQRRLWKQNECAHPLPELSESAGFLGKRPH
ncbi:hypothetical protein PMAYCL1PPCAC_31667, partial [Pristionchus mayeri]